MGAVLAGVVAALVLLAGCATGQRAQSSHEVPVVDGVSADVGSVQLRNIALAAPQAQGGYAVGGSASLTLTIVNNGNSNDQLIDVASPVAGAVTSSTPDSAAASEESSEESSAGPSTPSASSASSSEPGSSSSSAAAGSFVAIPCPAGQAVHVTPTASQMTITLQQLKQPLSSGESLSVTFTFQGSGSVTVQIPVALGEGAESTPTVNVEPSGE